MKITFVTANWVDLGGGTRVIAIYSELLQKRGHEVFVVCPEKDRPTLKQQLKSLLKGQGLISTKRTEKSHFDHLNIPRKVVEHSAPITDDDVPDGDIVIATWWETAEWVANLSPKKGAKVYFIQHHEVHNYLPIERVKKTYRLPLHKITISQWLVDLMKSEYGDDQVELIFNSVDTKQFNAPVRGKQKKPTIGMLYSTNYIKGCEISLKAFGLVKQQFPELKLVSFGTQEPSSELPLPPGTQYFRQPDQDKIKDIYASCDVWLCGSEAEGFHLPPLEAMACRCPVISTKVGGPIDIIKDRINGYLVSIGDYQALADRLIKILSLSDAEWKIMSDQAYHTATKYTWEDATDLFEEALFKIIEKK